MSKYDGNLYLDDETGMLSFGFTEHNGRIYGDEGEEFRETIFHGVFVSDWGRVFNAYTGHFLKSKPMDKHGHLGVCLTLPYFDRPIYAYTHRLIADAFLDNERYRGPIVRHLDDNPENNELDNIMLGTMKENHEDCVRNGRYSPVADDMREIGLDKLRKPVIAIRLSDGKEEWFRSINDCCRALGLQQSNASKVLYGQRKHTRGYSLRWVVRP